jgi:hypothetical protein
MTTLKKQIIIWCVIAVGYFIAIFVPVAIYYRTTGDPPLFLAALHHEFLVLTLFSILIGKNVYPVSQAGQEIVAFGGGLVFYAGIGALLGLLQHFSGRSKHLRGLFYAILCSMLGYTIGVWINGHPPIFILLNPPLFLMAGYLFGLKTFHSQDRRQSG